MKQLSRQGYQILKHWADKEILEGQGTSYQNGLNDGTIILAQALIKHVIEIEEDNATN